MTAIQQLTLAIGLLSVTCVALSIRVSRLARALAVKLAAINARLDMRPVPELPAPKKVRAKRAPKAPTEPPAA